MLVTDTIPSPINGVSQQPPQLRSPSQVEAMDNTWPSEVHGASKRPGTLVVGTLPSEIGDAAVHTISRGTLAESRAVIVKADGTVQVFGLDGTSYPVEVASEDGYLTVPAGTAQAAAWRFVTIAESTVLLNTTKTVASNPDTSPYTPTDGSKRGYLGTVPAALVIVRQGNYGKTYRIKLDTTDTLASVSTTVSFDTPTGSDANQSPQVATDYIASQLESQLSSAGSGWSVVRYSSTLSIARIDARPFSVDVSDGFAGNAMYAIRSRVQRFDRLPNFAPEGYTVEVAGDDSSQFTSYYVKSTKDSALDSTVVWQETWMPGIPYKLDPRTLPHLLQPVRYQDGTLRYRLSPITWAPRAVGDLTSNPWPSFVGKTLTDLFLAHSRLGVLCGESVVLSRANDFFSFFRTTVTQVLDDDPIDLTVNTADYSPLTSAVHFQQNCILFSPTHQHTLSGGDVWTPKSVSIDLLTRYANDPALRPVAGGSSCWFAAPQQDSAKVFELTVAGNTISSARADPINAHCPTYLPGRVIQIAASTNLSCLAVRTENAPNTLYLYKWVVLNQERVQAAWFRWPFDPSNTIRAIAWLDHRLVLIFDRAGQAHIEVVDPSRSSAEDPDPRLDHRIPGQDGGVPYEQRIEYSRITIAKTQYGGSRTPILTGRLQIRRIHLVVAHTGYLEAQVTPDRRPTITTPFIARRSNDSPLSQSPPVTNGVFNVPILTRADTCRLVFSNPTPLPSTLQTLEWEGSYQKNTQTL